jgi:TonB family protein
MLNVRREAVASAEVVAQVPKGERLALLSITDEWARVRLGNGAVGFVSTQHVIREGVSRRRGCAPDSDFSFAKSPVPAFPENAPHGIVTVDAYVDARGNVTSTRVISNSTGDESLAALAAREIRQAKFVAPIRNCVAKAFIFTYKRSF